MRFANVVREGDVIPQGLSFVWWTSHNYVGWVYHHGLLITAAVLFRWGDFILKLQARKVIHDPEKWLRLRDRDNS